MPFSELRLRAYNAVLRNVQGGTRQRRMQVFLDRMRIETGARILDLGGNPGIWNLVPQRLEITILNLPGETGQHIPTHHQVRFVEADACDAPQFQPGEFDIVFSNSVIEHVGPEDRQAAFAATVKRLARRFWVQTPSIWFPIEAHTGVPFWWFYPDSVRQAVLRHWHTKLPAWSDSMAGTRVLRRERLQELFPSAEIYVDTLGGIPKSYAAYCPG